MAAAVAAKEFAMKPGDTLNCVTIPHIIIQAIKIDQINFLLVTAINPKEAVTIIRLIRAKTTINSRI